MAEAPARGLHLHIEPAGGAAGGEGGGEVAGRRDISLTSRLSDRGPRWPDLTRAGLTGPDARPELVQPNRDLTP